MTTNPEQVISRLKSGLNDGIAIGITFVNGQVTTVGNNTDPVQQLKLLDLCKAQVIAKL